MDSEGSTEVLQLHMQVCMFVWHVWCWPLLVKVFKGFVCWLCSWYMYLVDYLERNRHFELKYGEEALTQAFNCVIK